MQSMTYLGMLHTAASGHPTSGGHATITTTGSVSGGTLVVLLVIGWAVWKVRRPATVAGGVGKTVRGTWKAIVAVWTPIRAVVRFYGGRELRGGPRSTATFLRAGTRTTQAAKPAPAVTMESVAAATPRVSLVKPVRRQPSPWARKAAAWFDTYSGRGARALDTAVRVALWAARTVGRVVRACRALWRGLRAVYGVVAPVVATLANALRSWGCWPYAARGLARLALTAAVLGLLVPAWRLLTLLLLLLAVVAAVVAAYRYQPKKPGDDAVYGPRIWAVLRADLGLPEDEPRESWLLLPERLAEAGARITIRLPWTWRGSETDRANLSALVNSRLPGEWVARVVLTGEHFTATFTHKPAPRPKPPEPECPDVVDFFDPEIQAAIAACKRGEIVLGRDENQKIVVRKLDGETPHWALSVGTGGGKSTFNVSVVVQLVAQGYTAIVADVKRSSVEALEGIPGVHIYNDPQNVWDMRNAIEWFKEEIEARSYYRSKDKSLEFPGLLLLIEEANEFADISKEWWDDNRKPTSDKEGPADPAADPVWGDVASAARLGRFVRGNILAVFQDLRDQAMGGKGLRNLFRLKFLGNFSANTWKNTVGTTPVPESVDKAGRMMIVEGNSKMWVQTPYADGDALKKWALDHRQAQNFDPTAGLYGTPPERSAERMPRLVEAASRDAGPWSPNGGPGGGAREETAGGLSRSGDTVTASDASVTAQRDRFRLIPGQGGQEAQQAAQGDPTAPPELLALAEVARRLEGEQGVPNGTTMRAHKVRYDDFPQPTVINGKELFTESQIRAYYQAREQKA